MDESERIKKAYALRDSQGKRQLYSIFQPAALYISQQREREIIELLSQQKLTDLEESKILEVGCGTGNVLRNFLGYGAQPENCFGIDLLPDRIAQARKLSPNLDFQCGNAEEMPYDTGFFDIVICFMVFSSILDGGMKSNLAREMLRVLKPDGFILWYDYYVNNPRNPDVRGITRQEIRELFAGCDTCMKRITLAPPLTRTLVPYSWLAVYLLEKIKLLNTHYLGLIRKNRRVN